MTCYYSAALPSLFVSEIIFEKTPVKLILLHQTQAQYYLSVHLWPGRETDNEHTHSQKLKSVYLSSCQPQILETVSSSDFSCKQLKSLRECARSFSRNKGMWFPRLLRGFFLLSFLSEIMKLNINSNSNNHELHCGSLSHH